MMSYYVTTDSTDYICADTLFDAIEISQRLFWNWVKSNGSNEKCNYHVFCCVEKEIHLDINIGSIMFHCLARKFAGIWPEGKLLQAAEANIKVADFFTIDDLMIMYLQPRCECKNPACNIHGSGKQTVTISNHF